MTDFWQYGAQCVVEAQASTEKDGALWMIAAGLFAIASATVGSASSSGRSGMQEVADAIRSHGESA